MAAISALGIEHDETLCARPTGASQAPPSAWLGCRVGTHHRIRAHLGSGGMGHVFKTEHVTTGEPAAVKLMPDSCPPTLAFCFIDEAHFLARLSHPNVVRLLDSGDLDDESPYILMEYAPGQDLSRWLTEHRLGTPRFIERALSILEQLASALDHVHTAGIVHRDVKPSNVMIDTARGDCVKLIDFGVAAPEGFRELGLDGSPTGTPAYMAPEQVVGECTRSCDLYSLAAVALEMLTGKPPYDHPTLSKTIAAIMHDRPELPSERGLHIPGLDALFSRALARDPSDRFPSAAFFVAALRDALTGQLECDGMLAAARPEVQTITLRAHVRDAERTMPPLQLEAPYPPPRARPARGQPGSRTHAFA